MLLLLLAAGAFAVAAYLLLRAPAKARNPAPPTSPEVLTNTAPMASSSPALVSEKPLPESTPGAPVPAPLAHSLQNPKVRQCLSTLLDESQPNKLRRQAVRELARLGTEESIVALKLGLREASASVKGLIAESLGTSTNREARVVLMDLIEKGDEAAVLGAIRGFGERGDAEATDLLSNLLFSGQHSETTRIEAALALERMARPEATTALMRAVTEIQDEAIVGPAIDALARKPFAETSTFFQEYLKKTDVPTESKVAALEALGQAGGDACALLLSYATDSTPELRAAAALGLATTTIPQELSPRLLGLINLETSPDVRARLYQALANQENLDSAAILVLARREQDPAARLAVLNLAATGCADFGAPEMMDYFNATGVPELTSTALSGTRVNDRLSAVLALTRAGTPQAMAAVQQIAHESKDPKVLEAIEAVFQKKAAAKRPNG